MTDWKNERRNSVDAAIDRAVRDIMSAEPRPGFRRRVLHRIERGDSPRSRSWSWTWLSAGALAAAAIIVVLFVARRTDRPVEQPSIAREEPAATAPKPVPQPVEPPKAAAQIPPAPRVDRRPQPIEPRMVRAASLAPDAAALEPNADNSQRSTIPIDPIDVTPLTPPRVTIRPLPPLERIPIAPLPPPR
jgi:hypothetical protein